MLFLTIHTLNMCSNSIIFGVYNCMYKHINSYNVCTYICKHTLNKTILNVVVTGVADQVGAFRKHSIVSQKSIFEDCFKL